MLSDNSITPDQRKDFIGGITAQDQQVNAFSVVATQSQQNLLNQTVTGDGLRPSKDFQDDFVNAIGGSTAPTGFTVDQWNAAMSTRANLYRQVEVALDNQDRFRRFGRARTGWNVRSLSTSACSSLSS